MELLQLGARTAAVGLLWQPRENPRKRLKVEARELADALSRSNDARQFGHVALRPQHQEYGLGEQVDGALPSKVLALAGVLADQKPGRWAGSYALASGRTWVVCVIEGQVLADGDVVIEEPEAAARLLESWRESYPGLEIEDYPQQDHAREVLTQAVAAARAPMLVALESSALVLRRYALLGATAALLLLGLLSWHWFSERPSEPERVPPTRVLLAPRASLPPPQADYKAVPPSALGAACVAPYLRAPITVAGWWMQEWRCESEGTLEIIWRRATDGSFLHIPSGARITVEDPNLAQERRTLHLPPPHDLAIADRAAVSAALYEVARLFSLQLTVTWPAAAALPTGVEVPGQSVTPTTVETGEFTLAAAAGAGTPLAILFEALGRVPGLAVRSVTWREYAWSTEGVLYAMPSTVQL